MLFVYRCDLAIRESAQLGSSGSAYVGHILSHNYYNTVTGNDALIPAMIS